MKTILLTLIAISVCGCSAIKNDRYPVFAKRFDLFEQDVIKRWTSPTLPDGCSYSLEIAPSGKGYLIVYSDLSDIPFFGIYDIRWHINQPRDLRIEYQYRDGQCHLKNLSLKWIGPQIQVRSQIEGCSWKHRTTLEPEKRLVKRIEAVNAIARNLCDPSP